jgi:hypothetical protein
MIADDLSKAQICEDEAGRIHAVGLRFGYCLYEQSTDGGATKVAFDDGLTWRYVDQSPVDDEAPAIECLQNGLILVALTQGGVVRLHRSELDGWVFEPVGSAG